MAISRRTNVLLLCAVVLAMSFTLSLVWTVLLSTRSGKVILFVPQKLYRGGR